MCNECENCKRLRAIIEQDNVEPVGIVFGSDKFGYVLSKTTQHIENNTPVYLHPPKASTEQASKDWVMVPREPTEEMIAALKTALKGWLRDEDCYKAMIAAAPTTPKGVSDEKTS